MLNEILNIYDSGLRDENTSLTQSEAIYKITEKKMYKYLKELQELTDQI